MAMTRLVDPTLMMMLAFHNNKRTTAQMRMKKKKNCQSSSLVSSTVYLAMYVVFFRCGLTRWFSMTPPMFMQCRVCFQKETLPSLAEVCGLLRGAGSARAFKLLRAAWEFIRSRTATKNSIRSQLEFVSWCHLHLLLYCCSNACKRQFARDQALQVLPNVKYGPSGTFEDVLYWWASQKGYEEVRAKGQFTVNNLAAMYRRNRGDPKKPIPALKTVYGNDSPALLLALDDLGWFDCKCARCAGFRKRIRPDAAQLVVPEVKTTRAAAPKAVKPPSTTTAASARAARPSAGTKAPPAPRPVVAGYDDGSGRVKSPLAAAGGGGKTPPGRTKKAARSGPAGKGYAVPDMFVTGRYKTTYQQFDDLEEALELLEVPAGLEPLRPHNTTVQLHNFDGFLPEFVVPKTYTEHHNRFATATTSNWTESRRRTETSYVMPMDLQLNCIQARASVNAQYQAFEPILSSVLALVKMMAETDFCKHASDAVMGAFTRVKGRNVYNLKYYIVGVMAFYHLNLSVFENHSKRKAFINHLYHAVSYACEAYSQLNNKQWSHMSTAYGLVPLCYSMQPDAVKAVVCRIFSTFKLEGTYKEQFLSEKGISILYPALECLCSDLIDVMADPRLKALTAQEKKRFKALIEDSDSPLKSIRTFSTDARFMSAIVSFMRPYDTEMQRNEETLAYEPVSAAFVETTVERFFPPDTVGNRVIFQSLVSCMDTSTVAAVMRGDDCKGIWKDILRNPKYWSRHMDLQNGKHGNQCISHVMLSATCEMAHLLLKYGLRESSNLRLPPFSNMCLKYLLDSEKRHLLPPGEMMSSYDETSQASKLMHAHAMFLNDERVDGIWSKQDALDGTYRHNVECQHGSAPAIEGRVIGGKGKKRGMATRSSAVPKKKKKRQESEGDEDDMVDEDVM